MNTVLLRQAFTAELISSISMCRRASVLVVGIGAAASPIAMTSDKIRDLVRAGFGEIAQLTDDVLAGRTRVELAHTEYGSHHP